ncbi:hypothetical protein MED01_001023 [Micromonospora sp. MED01]|uniref:hypothetical protein n=1 Tax=Micromonospora alfalfae TaxID=2911212 RepID=UPI001EE865BE|nr:hypothetical protein [Micromonospora alfalfae]MCG5462910.1 hypothetical protein [Micromonospora alfalfae]
MESGKEHLYVLQFNNGVIKVGRTADPRTRNVRHERDCGRYGLTIERRWFSGEWAGAHWAEQQLITILAKIGRRTPAGREYFQDVAFSIACEQARQVYYTTCPTCGNGVVPAPMRMAAIVANDASDEDGSLVCDFRLPCHSVITGRLHDQDMAPDGRYPLRRGEHYDIQLEYAEIGAWDVWAAQPRMPR